MVVHFPIVLAILAGICVVGWLFRDRLAWLQASIWIGILGFIGAVFALRTGEVMEEQSEGVAIVDELVHTHEEMAERLTWILGLAVVFLLYSYWRSKADVVRPGTALWMRLVAALLFLTVAALAVLTGHIGGLMSWGVPA